MPAAPLYDALQALAQQGARRFHLPGHKGKAAFGNVFELDFTEIPATGNLYGDGGIIQLAEAEAARYYGAASCFFLTCGATQGVKAALAAFCGERTPVVLDRNCHQSALDGCAALDLRPEFIYPALEPSGITGDIDAGELRAALQKSGASAAMITSPTYYGRCLDIEALAHAAHSLGAALIVDSAHGSHLRACGMRDAVAQGADAVVFSAHKTLTALGQGAYLLTQSADADFCAKIRAFTAFFGTTSPSYPIMASLDLARCELEAHPGAYRAAAALCAKTAAEIGLCSPFSVHSPSAGGDPCRLTVCTASGGLSGFVAAEALRARGIEPEMADERHVVLIFTPSDSAGAARAASRAFIEIGDGLERRPLPCTLPLPRMKRALWPREACFAAGERVSLNDAAGRIAAQNVTPYPPGVPVVTVGEQIDDFAVEYLLGKGYNGLNGIWVTER